MTNLIVACVIFVAVFGADYLLYKKNPSTYRYVSRRTFALFIGGQIVLLYIFYPYFEPFINNLVTETAFTGGLLVILLGFSVALTRERLLVCHTSSRTESCLTPGYVLTKGPELVFQQMSYLAVAFALADILGTHWYTYIVFILILLVLHTPVVLSMNRQAVERLTFGIAILAAPIYYVFHEMQLFWPAIYVHAILYVFLWLTFADWEGSTWNHKKPSAVDK